MKKFALGTVALVASVAKAAGRLTRKVQEDQKPAKSKGPRKASTYRGERRLHAKAFARAHGLPFLQVWERKVFRTFGRR